MRDYWLTQDLLKAAGLGLIALSLVGVGMALWLPKKWWAKLLALFAVGFLISIPVRQSHHEGQGQLVQVDEASQRLAIAKNMFARNVARLQGKRSTRPQRT